MIYAVIGLAILLFSVFIYYTLKLKRLRKQRYDQIWDEFTQHNRDRVDDFNRITEDKIKALKERIAQKQQEEKNITEQIAQKQEFNKQLFTLREDELNRLIEEKKKEKEKQIELEVRQFYEEKRAAAETEFSEFLVKNIELRDFIKQETDECKAELDEFNAKRQSINAAILREREIEEREHFYKIEISKSDIEDIEILNNIAPQLRNRDILNKLIYDTFFKRPLLEMEKRVLGMNEICGIYKITYTKTGEAYIGKSTNINRRWTEHVKSALNIGSIAHTTFHDRLRKDGIWNYTFEVLEQVPKEDLTDREKFWIGIYGTDTQLNMKVG